MNKPSSYERFHWAIFNFLGKYVMGWGFIFVTIVFIASLLLDQEGKWHPKDERMLDYAFFLTFGILGILLVKVKPYYPKQYSEYYKSIGKIKE